MRSLVVCFLMLALVTVPAGAAQQPGDRAAKAARQAVVERFAAAAPAIGEPVPDVSMIDPRGRVHPLRDLVGEHYAVLVLGCLT